MTDGQQKLAWAAGVAALAAAAGAAWWLTQRKGTFTVPIRDFSDPNWSGGVTRGLPAGVYLEGEGVKAGDTLLLPGSSGTEARQVTHAWPGDGTQVFVAGPVLNPALVHGGMTVRVRKARST